MRENIHGFANEWTFTSKENKERLIEEVTGVLETYYDLKGSPQVSNELAEILKLAQSRSCEIVAAIKNLSPLAQSMLNYPPPLPPLVVTTCASINDEIIARLLRSVRLSVQKNIGYHLLEFLY